MKAQRIFVILLFFILFYGCQCGKKGTLPDDLIGVWKTSAPQYADRFFEIKKDEIIFGTGEGSLKSNAIINIETEKVRGEETSLYTIQYKDQEGERYTFSFYYDPVKSGVIRFKNQTQIAWTRESRQ
jgi:hypothetical protein